MAKIVIALGGNALGHTPSEQKKAVQITSKVIVNLYNDGHKIIVVHGNGPQVGWINNAFMVAFKEQVSQEVVPFPECGAMSQGYIGYHIQNSIQNEFTKHNLKDAKVITLVSQTIVDKDDQGFTNPTKPIGNFMTEVEAKALALENHWIVKDDAGRGWRRVIASPKPIGMPSLPIIKMLIDKQVITIVGGGGGIPVINESSLQGVDAVIDKDATAAFIASQINADSLIILTAIDKVKVNFGQLDEKSLDEISSAHLEEYINQEQFAPGSMLPKIKAAIDFVKTTQGSAYIGHLQDAHEIVNGNAGTKITK